MNSKKEKYLTAIQFFNLLNSEKDSINLIAHVSDINTIQLNLLKSFCHEKNIKNVYIKLNLLKKVTRNPLFLNLFSGPTRMFFFKDFLSFSTFIKNNPLGSRIIPLAVFFDNKIYSYSFFDKQLKIYAKNLSLDKIEINKNLIIGFNKQSVHFIQNLSYNFNTFIQFLSHFKKKNNN